jgi:beta-N-acetylhexosaminidase
MGFDGSELSTATERMLTTIQPGGIILFARNINSAQQTHGLLTQCQKVIRTPIFSCVDLEGGTVDRFRQVIAPAPSAAKVAGTNDKKLFEKHGRLIGEEVRALGFNTDFAPVSDLNLPPAHNVLGSRAVSEDPKEVITYVRSFLKGLHAAKVLGCGKHFPGLGEANLDTHHELPAINKQFKDMWEQDLVPYRELKDSFPFVMVAHAAYPSVTNNNLPASLSKKWMTDILRKKIGYRGLILSDDLEMGGVLAIGSIEEVTIETLRAGADMFLICHREDLVWRAYEAVLQLAERDKKFERTITQAADRVLRLKGRARELKKKAAPAPDEATVAKLREGILRFTDEVEKRAQASA